MKQLTKESTERLLRRTALIQLHTGALTRDAASLSASIATGGDSDYSRRFGAAAAALAQTGHTPDQLAQKLETRLRSRGAPALQRDYTQSHPDIKLDPNREMPL
jgi:hypothetical protein